MVFALAVLYAFVPALVVAALGFLWTWRLAYARPELRTVVWITGGAVLAGLLLYPLPIAGLSWWSYQRTILPFDLVVPDRYAGPALLVACADDGVAPVDGRVALDENGIARVRWRPDDLTQRSQINARTASGATRSATFFAADLPGGGCGWFEITIYPEPGDPYQIPYSTEDVHAREARVLAEGRTFAQVSADTTPPPPQDTDLP